MRFWHKIKNIFKKTSLPSVPEIPDEEDGEDEEDPTGIYIVFELKNNGDQNIYVDTIDPNPISSQSLGLFLFLIETGNLYGEILKEIKDLSKLRPECKEYLEQAFGYKQLLETQLDSPTMRPSDVFNFKH